MKAFVTGATGFIGRRVAEKLLDRGYDVYVLARSPAAASGLAARGAHVVKGDINHVSSVSDAMEGSDVVFHIAGWYKIGAHDRSPAQRINVEGTRNVLTLACTLGVPKIVYTSTVAVFGDTQGQLPDEGYRMRGARFATEYDRTKWVAHYQVAEPLIRQGCPIIIVMPGGVFGPGDNSIIGDMLRLFYRGLLPVVPGPETVLTLAHVDDIAEGHILAAEKGRPGESYILAGPPLNVREIVAMWAAASGRGAPSLAVPARLLKPFGPLMGALAAYLPMPAILSQEAINTLGLSYMGSSDKARAELGWQTRPVEEGLQETFAALAREEEIGEPGSGPGQAAIVAAVGIVVALVLWRILSRDRRQ